MKYVVINGPNLNFLGIREKSVYGNENYEALVRKIKDFAGLKDIECDVFQSNSEGAIIDLLQKCYYDEVTGIVINPGAYTHYSYAIRDAIASINIPTVEVHISNVYEREAFRHISVTEPVCVHQIVGHGTVGYLEGLQFLLDLKER